MIISMTGFGRAFFDAPFGKLTVEIQAVNRKYLELFVSMPKELSRFEPEVRKWVGESVSRGQVSVRIFLLPSPESLEGLLPDLNMLKRLKKEWEAIGNELGLDSQKIDLPFLMEHLPVSPRQDLGKEEDLAALHHCVKEALEGFLKMKKMEGKALAVDLLGRLDLLERLSSDVEKLSPDATQKMRQRLAERMKEVLQSSQELDERLLREVALFAERVDIAEELTRLRSHLEQFRELPKKGGAGRKMDFLIQEIGREINTIGSKSMDSKISHLVVEMKSELEKMREQVQNIE